jgi:hypothetical protein
LVLRSYEQRSLIFILNGLWIMYLNYSRRKAENERYWPRIPILLLRMLVVRQVKVLAVEAVDSVVEAVMTGGGGGDFWW